MFHYYLHNKSLATGISFYKNPLINNVLRLKYEKFIDMISDPRLQLTFKKLVKFWCSIKEKYSQLSGKTVKTLLFNYIEFRCSSYVHFNQNNVLRPIQLETDVRIQLSCYTKH